MTQRSDSISSEELRPSERRFLAAMQQLGYGRFESLLIREGELVLDPWPTTVRSVKFGNATTNQPDLGLGDFELKKQLTELFAHVRALKAGVILVIEVRGGLPFSMEIENRMK